jgi:hypothetical protein
LVADVYNFEHWQIIHKGLQLAVVKTFAESIYVEKGETVVTIEVL